LRSQARGPGDSHRKSDEEGWDGRQNLRFELEKAPAFESNVSTMVGTGPGASTQWLDARTGAGGQPRWSGRGPLPAPRDDV